MLGTVDVRLTAPEALHTSGLAIAPILHARRGTLERFSDVPLFMYVERGLRGLPRTLSSSRTRTAAPRPIDSMATWGRSTGYRVRFQWRD